MKTALVLGAGWAGLSCAVRLAEKGYKVTILEQSKRLGGRASSFKDEKAGDAVDNGQHLFMGCYTETIAFLKTIGSLEKLRFQSNLSIDFVDKTGKISSLKCGALPSPFHLLSGIWGLNTLSIKDKLAMVKVYRRAKRWKNGGGNGNQTVDQWLEGLGQSEKSRRHFWDLITIATLNEHSSIAEAGSLAFVLKEALFSSREKSQIAFSRVGLSELCGPPAEQYLEQRQGKILTNKLVSKISVVGDSVRGVVLRDGTTMTADVYVSALPFFVLRNVLESEQLKTPFFFRMKMLESSPIFSISLWFDRPITDRDFVALLDTNVQWLFNKGKILSSTNGVGYVSLVISGARKYMGMSSDEILKMCLDELHLCFPESRKARLAHWLVQREKNATLSPKIGYSVNRLSQKTPVRNLFLCGDWTDTGYPATIESAVLSGVKAVAYLAGNEIESIR